MEQRIDAVIRKVEPELSRLLDTRNLYVALCDPHRTKIEFAFAKQNGIEVALGAADCPPAYRDRPFGAGLTEYVIRKSEPLLIEADFDRCVRELDILAFPIGTKCWLGAPLKVGGDVLGVIGLQNFEAERVFDAGHRRVLATVANQTAVAIANARLYQRLEQANQDLQRSNQALQQKNQELEVLSGIYEKIIKQGIESVDKLLDLIYSETQSVLKMADGLFFIALYDEKEDEVSFGLVIELEKGEIVDEIRWGKRLSEAVPQWMPRKRSATPRLTEYVMQERKPILIRKGFLEWATQTGIQTWPSIGLKERHTLSWLGVPMLAGQRIIGVISIQSLEQEYAFDEVHANRLFRMAGQTGVAIENARLYAQLNDAYEVLRRARERELMAVLGEITVGLIHKMANTIGPIPALVDRIGKNISAGSAPDSDVQNKLHRIKEGAADALTYTGGMSQILLLEKINKEPVDLKVPLGDALRQALPVLEQRGVRVELTSPPTSLVMDANAPLLIEAFRNIISNAAEAMTSGGTLTIVLDAESPSSARIRIADTGEGIPDDIKPKIFQAGFSSKKTGKGVGLWFTKKAVVDYHQGKISFDSQEGIGTTFTILLPLSTSTTLSDSTAASAEVDRG